MNNDKLTDSKPTPLFEVGTYFVQDEKNKLFKIIFREFKAVLAKNSRSKVKDPVRAVHDWLYTIEYTSLTGKPTYSNYYENRLTTECTKVVNQELPKVIYDEV